MIGDEASAHIAQIIALEQLKNELRVERDRIIQGWVSQELAAYRAEPAACHRHLRRNQAGPQAS